MFQWAGCRFLAIAITLLLAVQIACRGRAKVEPQASGETAQLGLQAERLSLVPEGAYVSIELTRKDQRNISEHEADCFIWPKTCGSNFSSFVEGASAGEPVQALQLAAGLYDVELFYGRTGLDAALRWHGQRKNIWVDRSGALLEVLVTSRDQTESKVFIVKLQAQNETRPDISICDRDAAAFLPCNTMSQIFQCAVAGVALNGCSKANLYEALQRELCRARINLKESEFAALFSCTEVSSNAKNSKF